VTDGHLVDAVVRAVLAQLVHEEEPPCACHAAPRGCCPDRMGRMLGQGAARFGLQAGTNLYPRDIARRIDHTLLKPEATREQIEALCREAREHGFATVCVNPTWVSLCAVAEVKAYEAARVVERGACEVDMVMNVGALKSRDYRLGERDIAAVVESSRGGGALVKVIIEAALLTDDEKVKACVIARAAGADFVKTSTGFGPGGATAADVALMRRVVGPEMGVKAAGGVRDLKSAQAMLEAGADRIGASVGVKIVQESRGAVPAAGAGPGGY